MARYSQTAAVSKDRVDWPDATHPLVVSIHDVMPETLRRVTHLLDELQSRGIRQTTLLVVPGREWKGSDLDQLRRWSDAGHRLAGHGWSHHCERTGSWWHRMHSCVLSRRAAEHLAVSPDERAAIITRCANWFVEHGLPPPKLYVPPAWALGTVELETCAQLPFELYEVLTGVWQPARRILHRLPLVGFEADTQLRQTALRGWNYTNVVAARRLGRPLRLAIHPFDLELRMAADLLAMLEWPWQSMSYEQVAARQRG